MLKIWKALSYLATRQASSKVNATDLKSKNRKTKILGILIKHRVKK